MTATGADGQTTMLVSIAERICWRHISGPLFRKYVCLFLAVVCVGGASETTVSSAIAPSAFRCIVILHIPPSHPLPYPRDRGTVIWGR
jgi:hypothetical protein